MGCDFTDDSFYVELIEDSDQENEMSECYEQNSESDEENDEEDEIIETNAELAYQIDNLLLENHSLQDSIDNLRRMNSILETDKLKLQSNINTVLFITVFCIGILCAFLCQYIFYQINRITIV